MNPLIQKFKDQMSPKVPEFYYHSELKEFLFKQTKGDPRVQNWIAVSEQTASEILADAGVRATTMKGEERSPAKQMLLDSRLKSERSVQYAGPIAGYSKGFTTEGSYNALVTSGPMIPKSIKGNCADIRSIIDQLFGIRAVYIYSYLKLSRRMLIAENRRGMPAIIMVGPKDCGKSFFQEHIVTPFLGGRQAMVDRFITGEDKFNKEVYTNEHLIVGDAVLSPRTSDRVNLGNRIKALVANETQSMRSLFKDSIQVKPFTRLTFALNMETENIAGLPPMGDSIDDKLMIFLVNRVKWPVLALTPEEVKEFEHNIHAQIPAFCWWLENEFIMPSELQYDKYGKKARFCIACYHDPRIVKGLDELSPEFRMMELIKACFFTIPMSVSGKPSPLLSSPEIRMSALDLEQALKSDDSPVRVEARQLLSSGTRVGAYLERWHRKYPGSVKQDRAGGKRLWVIRDIDTLLDAGDVDLKAEESE